MSHSVVGLGALLVFLVANLMTFYQAAYFRELGFWGEQFPLVSYVFVTVLAFIGIVFGSLYRQVINGPTKVDIWVEFGRMWKSKDFVLALIVSPFVLLAVYGYVRKAPWTPSHTY